MSNFRILLLVLAVALVAGAAGYLTRISTQEHKTAIGDVAASSGSSNLPQSNKPLWVWSFNDLDGVTRQLNEWQGPLLVINFWATWCPPCLKEIPSFTKLQTRFGSDRVQFLGVAYDHLEAVQEFVAKQPINYPVLMGGDDVAVFMRELGNKIGALPFTAVVDSTGKVLATQQGEWHENEAAETLTLLLDSPSL